MKRFIIISLLTALVGHAFPCAYPGTDNYYLFCVCDKQEFSDRVNSTTQDNWKAYLGSDKEYYWFDADEVIRFAQAKGDALMVSYVMNLQKYLQCSDEVRREQWDYPTKEQLQQRRQTLQSVRTYASDKLKTRLRSQHALLYMRCNMLLGNHSANVTFWENTASQYIETVYKEMMQNIYAGALLKTGRPTEAARLFAEQGDWNSLMTQYYQQRSFVAIRQEYLRDANSPVLPFLLEDFVNNSQEAYDAEHHEGLPGKMFVRDIKRSEAQEMIRFASNVVKEGKTEVPALWKSAQAWLEYFFGDRKQALADAKAGTTLEGTERMKDVARIIYMYVKADVEPINSNFDNWLAGELNWLNQHLANYYYNRSRARLLNCVVGEKYAKANQPYMSAALYAMNNSECAFTLVDTMKVEDLPQYLRYIETPAQTPLEKVVKAKLKIEEERLNDLIGTKYLRVRCWEDAIFWLNKVPLSYYNQKGYAVYAANRRYTVEPWMKRQWLKSNLEWDHDEIHLKSNPKLDFVMEMYRMEGELDLLSGKEYYQRCYDLAVRYAQAHFTGDCWFLTHDGKSVYDVQKPNETDLAAKALAYLQKATQTKDMKLKEKALFAMTYCIFYPKTWYTMEWNDGKRDYEQMEHQDSPQYAALTNLLRFERANANNVSNYVTLCDEYQTFAKSH